MLQARRVEPGMRVLEIGTGPVPMPPMGGYGDRR